ncbi:MAG: hypothetical protein LBS85_06405 [Clostridiales Family XIII bacterium]|nr:hypothetical protein [Clostridiales Family XIII bacterium]
MGKSRATGNSTGFIWLIVAVFAVAVIVCVGAQLFLSPDFAGFGKPVLGEPVVTYLKGEVREEDAPDTKSVYNWRDHPVLIVGDSLTQGARKEIAKVVPDATIDAKVSRNMATGVQILADWDDAGLVLDDAAIVVCLANNITDTTLKDTQRVIDMIRPGQSLILMTGHGRSNMNPVNELIRSLPKEYSYITVADWDLTIAQSPALLGDDGIHINGSKGNALYADLIVSALEVAKPKP